MYLFLGALAFAITALDIVKTTFSSNGGGKITNVVSRTVWVAFFSAAGKQGKSKLLEYAGPAILVSVLVAWVLGLWGGLFLVLLSDADSIVNSTTLASASALEKLYYAGFTLSTLGVGDYKAANSFWRIVTSASAFSRLAFITASITYFVPVLSAVDAKGSAVAKKTALPVLRRIKGDEKRRRLCLCLGRFLYRLTQTYTAVAAP